MSTESGGAYRWWENYLVRYLMPSIAGAVIVSWLITAGDNELKEMLLLEVGSEGLQTPTVLLLFLYGNLFCYISSYPILGFHVTRVIDFDRGVWRRTLWDGYITTLFLACAVLLISTLGSGSTCLSRAIPFVIAFVFAGFQLYRIYLAMSTVTFDGLKGPISKVFAYTYALSKQRGVAEEKQGAKDQTDQETGGKVGEEDEWQKCSVCRRDFIDSYRHMREHGNSAFIFVLELTLAGLCYLVLVAFRAESAFYQLAALGVLFAVWALPAMFIHFVGQSIERRFSWYDPKVKA